MFPFAIPRMVLGLTFSLGCGSRLGGRHRCRNDSDNVILIVGKKCGTPVCNVPFNRPPSTHSFFRLPPFKKKMTARDIISSHSFSIPANQPLPIPPWSNSLAGKYTQFFMCDTWLSSARARCKSSQWAGPVVILNAPGKHRRTQPAARMAMLSSGNRIS